MREIKFRAWDKGLKVMVPNIQNQYCTDKNVVIRCFRDAIEYPQLELMQYTGLKDKNGKEIYEGDILQDDFTKGVVQWHDYFAAFSWDGGIEWGIIDHEEVEVIGNIYENPELLEEQK